jgi:DNA-binding NarL/FixJ family response regulator
VPWAERARLELESPRRSSKTADEVAVLLTAHEVQVAALLQRGATNREIASALYVSPKTVEYHLANVYRKLGLRSRTELALRLTRAEPESGRRQPPAARDALARA